MDKLEDIGRVGNDDEEWENEMLFVYHRDYKGVI